MAHLVHGQTRPGREGDTLTTRGGRGGGGGGAGIEEKRERDLGYDDNKEDEQSQEKVESTQPAKQDKKRGHTCP